MKKLILLAIFFCFFSLCYGTVIDSTGIEIEFEVDWSFVPDTLNDSSFTVGDSTLDSLLALLGAKNGRGYIPTFPDTFPDSVPPVFLSYIVEIEPDSGANGALSALSSNEHVEYLDIFDIQNIFNLDDEICDCVKKQYYTNETRWGWGVESEDPFIRGNADRVLYMSDDDGGSGIWENYKYNWKTHEKNSAYELGDFGGDLCGYTISDYTDKYRSRLFGSTSLSLTEFHYDEALASHDYSRWETFYLKIDPFGYDSEFHLFIKTNDWCDIYIFNESEYNFEDIDIGGETLDDLMTAGFPCIEYPIDNECKFDGGTYEIHPLHAWFPNVNQWPYHPGNVAHDGVYDYDYTDNYIGTPYLATSAVHHADEEYEDHWDYDWFDVDLHDYGDKIEAYISSDKWDLDLDTEDEFYLLFCPGTGEITSACAGDECHSPLDNGNWERSYGGLAYHLTESHGPGISIISSDYDCPDYEYYAAFNVIGSTSGYYEIYKIEYPNTSTGPPIEVPLIPGAISSATLLSSGSHTGFVNFTANHLWHDNSYEFVVKLTDAVDGCESIRRLAVIKNFNLEFEMVGDEPLCELDEVTYKATIRSYFLFEEDELTFDLQPTTTLTSFSYNIPAAGFPYYEFSFYPSTSVSNYLLEVSDACCAKDVNFSISLPDLELLWQNPTLGPCYDFPETE